jgi:ankyrin repeat protein
MALRNAARNGQLERVKQLLAAGADVNAADWVQMSMQQLGETPLIAAADAGRSGVVQLLLEAGASIDLADYSGSTPLHSAARGGHLQVVQLLLDSGANVNGAPLIDGITRPNLEGHTPVLGPLCAAAACGHREVVQLLLAAGAGIDAFDCCKQAPLLAATTSGEVEIARLLLASGANVNKSNGRTETPLYHAVLRNNLKMVQLLVRSGADVNRKTLGKTPVHLAAEFGQYEVVQLQLRAGADPTRRTPVGTAFLTAAEHGRMRVVQLLLDTCGRRHWQPTAADVADAAQSAARNKHKATAAYLDKELHKLYPGQLQRLFQDRNPIAVADALAIVLDGWASDVSSLDEQWAAVHKNEEDVAAEQKAVQHILVCIAGIAKHVHQA